MPRAPRHSPSLAALAPVIHTIRGERVIIDSDLSRLYGVETKILNRAVRRNREKFPPDFMFQLSAAEFAALRFQIGTSNTGRIVRLRSVTSRSGRGGRRYRPYAFTEHGALMAANVLNSPAATQMSVFVTRAFVRMRSLLTDTRELAKKLADLEADLRSRLDHHEAAITEFMGRLLQLLDPPPGPLPPPDKELGFHTSLRPPRRG